MRVCLIAPEFLQSWGGVGSYCNDLTRNLPKQTEIHVVTVENGKADDGHEGFGDAVPSNVIVHRVAMAGDTFFYNAGFQYAVNREIPKLSREFRFDLIHSNHAHMSDLLLKLRGFRTPSVTTIHTTLATQREGTSSSGLALKSLERSEKITFLAFPLLRRLENVYLKRTDNVICVSDFVRDNLSEEYGVPFRIIETIHNGIDSSMFSPSREKAATRFFPEIAERQGPKVLFSGRLIGLKGIHILIGAMKEVISEFPDITLVLAGEGNRNPLLSLFTEMGIASRNCLFLGQVERSRMPYLYTLSDVYVLPSFSESCPMGILEAMASGTPIVASNVGGIPELLKDGATGMLVPPGSPGALAEAIVSILRHPDEASLLARRALEEVKACFSIEKQVSRTMAMYERVLDGGA